MQFRLAALISAVFAVFAPLVANAETARKSWHPELVAAREADLSQEFEAHSLKLGSPVFLRVYKQTSEMELWVQRGPRYELFKTFGICRWSGGLGPKFYEGDRQSPEGVYRITTSDLIVNRRWDRAMNINYPNTFDQVNHRGGSKHPHSWRVRLHRLLRDFRTRMWRKFLALCVPPFATGRPTSLCSPCPSGSPLWLLPKRTRCK